MEENSDDDFLVESALLLREHVILLDPNVDLNPISTENIDLFQDAGYTDETSDLNDDAARMNVQKAKERASDFLKKIEKENTEYLHSVEELPFDKSQDISLEQVQGNSNQQQGSSINLFDDCSFTNIFERKNIISNNINNEEPDDALKMTVIENNSQNKNFQKNGVFQDESLYFESLPYEIIQKIMGYLSQYELCNSVALVSKIWLEYAYDPIHWIMLRFDPKYCLTSFVLASILKHTSLLRKVCLYAQCIDHLDMLHIAQACPLLQDLDLGFVSTIDDNFITVISEHCHNLQFLNVEGCILFNPKSITIICQEGKLTRLKGLNVSHCTKLGDESILTLARSKTQLEMLNVDGISWIMDSTIQELCRLRGATLKSLYLDGAELSIDSVHSIVEHCGQLEVLSWSFAELLTDTSVLHLKEMGTLRELTIKKGMDFSAKSVQAMFQDGQLTQLRKLDLSECTQLRDQGVAAMTNCCGANLTHLSLCWCWNITEEGLKNIVDKCRNLQDLNLLGIDKITGQCLIELDSKMPKLKFVNLNQCNKINDALVIDILRKQPNLRAINYYGEDFRTTSYDMRSNP